MAQFSIWEKETFFAPQDVIIVGSGFAGLWSAFYLKKKHPKLKVSIVDKGIIPTGASTRNAGFACFGSLTELVADGEQMGTEKMLQLVEMRYKGLQRIQKYFSKKEIDFELCGGYELLSDSQKFTYDELESQIAYLNTLLKPITNTKTTFRLIDEKMEEFGFGNTAHLIKNNLEGVLHSGKLLQCLLHQVQAMGVQVFHAINVKSFDLLDVEIELNTNQSFQFCTRQLLICTNAFAKDLLPDAEIIPARGQVLVTSPLKKLPWKGAFHSDEGYYYFRNLSDRILLGGARNKAFKDEQTTTLETSDFIQKELESYLRNVILPGHKEEYTIEHRWSGIMGMGKQKLPVVEQVLPNVFAALGMGGIGVAVAPVIGQKVEELMMQ
ncbi:MAG: NAD(P)/FAD-dependent oxidoreductase [Chitinophagaceae bacterium]